MPSDDTDNRSLNHAIESLAKAEHFLVVTRRSGEGDSVYYTYSSSDQLSAAFLTLYAQGQLRTDMSRLFEDPSEE